jgi:hypothetical protein
MTRTLDGAEARRLQSLGRDLEPAAPTSDVVDLLAVGAGVKPMAGLATCYTDEGKPAWDAVPPGETLGPDRLGDRLEEAGFDWAITPVSTVEEGDRSFTWYELLVGRDRQTVPRFVRSAGDRPGDRTRRQYGEALGYPDSAVDWFVDGKPETGYDSVFDVVESCDGFGATAPAVAASISYVPCPTVEGARDAVADGRELADALGAVDDVAGEAYAESILGERVRETLATYDAAQRWRSPLHQAMEQPPRTSPASTCGCQSSPPSRGSAVTRF